MMNYMVFIWYLPILLHNTSASSIEWVVRTIALFPMDSTRISHSYLLFSGSRPVEGSSRNTILGSPTRAIAIDNRLLIPPDSYMALNLAYYVSLTSFIDYDTLPNSI